MEDRQATQINTVLTSNGRSPLRHQRVHHMHPLRVQAVRRCTKCPLPVHGLHTNLLEPPAPSARGVGEEEKPSARLTARWKRNKKPRSKPEQRPNCSNDFAPSGESPTA